MLSIEGVSKSYGNKVAIRGISFEVPQGSTFGILGPNGAGKTTLIRIINQIFPADEGKIRINGRELQEADVNRIGYMPEERGLYKKMKVGDHVIYLARLKGLSSSEARKKTRWWFERLEMSEWFDKKVETLSKGMQQKVQFVATVIHEPELVILDEPFSGFDPVNAEAIKNELLRMRNDGTTIMLSTHRMESVEELCDYIAMIHRSEKVLDGKIADIKRQFRKGEYEISYRGEILNEWPSSWKILGDQAFDDALGAHKLKIGIEESDINEAISYMTERRQLAGFRELLPSVEEIFVEKAKQ